MRLHRVSTLATGVVALLASACSGSVGSGTSNDLGTSTSGLSPAKVEGAVLPDLVKRIKASTVPGNGDVNPYGVAFVPPGFPKDGLLDSDDILVSNFNNKANQQGTGTTIVRVNPKAAPSLFFSNAGAPGFSTALGVLSRGFVLIGRVPSINNAMGVSCGPDPADTTPVNVGPGTIQIIDRHGILISTIPSSQFLDGPWDLFVDDHGSTAQVYVSNVLTGTVSRIDFQVDDKQATVVAETQIASGYKHRCDPQAFLVGPTGLAFDRESELLYVASTGDNAIFAVSEANERTTDGGMGTPVVTDTKHLHGPLGLARARNGDLIAAQGDAVNPDKNHQSEIVEFTAHGKFVAEFSVDPDTSGAAFGLALDQRDGGDEGRFAAVEDDSNFLEIWNVR